MSWISVAEYVDLTVYCIFFVLSKSSPDAAFYPISAFVLVTPPPKYVCPPVSETAVQVNLQTSHH